MRLSISKLVTGFAVLAFASGVAGPASASDGRRGSPVIRFSNDSAVAGADASLTRSDEGMSMRLRTSELTPGHTVTVFWVIFNNPQACSHPHLPYRCGPGDLPPLGGDGSAQPSVVFAADKTVGRAGTATFGAHLDVGDTEDALFGPGLTSPQAADIHLVVCDGTQFSSSCAVQFAVFEA